MCACLIGMTPLAQIVTMGPRAALKKGSSEAWVPMKSHPWPRSRPLTSEGGSQAVFINHTGEADSSDPEVRYPGRILG